jgi:hypothetical protein
MSILSTVVNGIFANEAADETTDAARAANETARYIYDDTRDRNQYRENLGNAALAQLGGMYGIDGTQTFSGGGGSGGASFNGQGSQFNTQAYLAANPDVAQAFTPGAHGFNTIDEFAQAHYQNHGQREGRSLGIPQQRIDGAAANYAQGDAQTGAQGTSPFQAFYDSPDYQLAFTEGQQALEGSAAARGGLLSGNTGKALVDFGQNLANTTFGNYKNTLNNLGGIGQQANQAVTQAGQNYSAQFGQNQATIGAANANMYNQIGAGVNRGINQATQFFAGGFGG